jgi:hypothetical protein
MMAQYAKNHDFQELQTLLLRPPSPSEPKTPLPQLIKNGAAACDMVRVASAKLRGRTCSNLDNMFALIWKSFDEGLELQSSVITPEPYSGLSSHTLRALLLVFDCCHHESDG